jgi:hypothetical protein
MVRLRTKLVLSLAGPFHGRALQFSHRDRASLIEHPMPTGLTCYRVAAVRRAFIAAAVVLLAGCGENMAPMPAQPSVFAAPLPAPRLVNLEITFKANTACAELPAVARSRTYSAAVNTQAPLFNLDGGDFGRSSDPHYPSSWNVIYQNLSTDQVGWWFQDPELWEFLTDDSYVVVYGGPAHIPVDRDTMEPRTGDWPFWGRFTYCAEREPDSYPECEVPEITCQSTEHTLTIVKR